MQFNGINQYIDCGLLPSDMSMGGANDKTVMAWTYCSDFNALGAVFSMGTTGVSGQEFTLRPLGTDDNWQVEHNGTPNYSFSTGTTSLNVWWHFAVTYDGVTSRAYANGAEIATVTSTLNTTDTVGLTVGRWMGESQPTDIISYFTGRIADVRSYSRTLNASEIQSIYLSAGMDGIVNSLQGRWILNDGEIGGLLTGAQLNGSWNSDSGNEINPFTISNVSAPSGNNRLLVIFAGANDTSPLDLVDTTGVQYGGQNFTFRAKITADESFDNNIEFWTLDESGIVAASPPADIVFTWDTSPNDALFQYAFFDNVSGVGQTETAVTLTGTTLTTSAITGVSGIDLVLEGGASGTTNNWSALVNGFTLGLDIQGFSTSMVSGYKTSTGSDIPSVTNTSAPRIAMVSARLTGVPVGVVPPSLFVARTQNTVSGGTSLTLSVPSNTNGDLLVAFICATNSGTTAPNIDIPAGWILVATGDLTSGSPPSVPSLWIFRRPASSEPASYDFTRNATPGGNTTILGQMHSYQNVDTTEDTASIINLGDSINPICPSVSTSDGTFLVLRIMGCDGLQILATSSFPSGVNERGTNELNGVGNGCSLAVCDHVQSATSTGTKTYTLDGIDEWGCFTVTFGANSSMKDVSGSLNHPHDGDTQNGPNRVIGVLRA